MDGLIFGNLTIVAPAILGAADSFPIPATIDGGVRGHVMLVCGQLWRRDLGRYGALVSRVY
jgi:hypothetical protein